MHTLGISASIKPRRSLARQTGGEPGPPAAAARRRREIRHIPGVSNRRRHWGRHWVGAMAGGPLLFFCCKSTLHRRETRAAQRFRVRFCCRFAAETANPAGTGKKAASRAPECKPMQPPQSDMSAKRRGIAFPFLEQPHDSGQCVRTPQLAANGSRRFPNRDCQPAACRQGKRTLLAMFSLRATVLAHDVTDFSQFHPRRNL